MPRVPVAGPGEPTEKTCTDCGGGPWPLDRFYALSSGKPHSHCRDCTLRRRRELRDRDPEAFNLRTGAASKARRARALKVLDELQSVPCAGCGGRFPPISMQFHHLDRSAKQFNLSTAAGNRALETLLAEAATCEVICANCHNVRSHREGASSSLGTRCTGCARCAL